MTETARTRLPDACAALLQGNLDILGGFTDAEATQLVALLTRLIADVDRATSANQPAHSS